MNNFPMNITSDLNLNPKKDPKYPKTQNPNEQFPT
jgi:hypothetical protein